MKMKNAEEDKGYSDALPNRDSAKQEKDLKRTLNNFFKKNPGSAFTLRALTNRLEDIVKDPINLGYAKENLQVVLNKMEHNGKISLVQQNGEDHYIFTVEKKEASEGASLNLGPFRDWIDDNCLKIIGWSILLGLLVGLLQFTSYAAHEFLIWITVIIITISVIGEIIIISNLSKKSLKYTPPIYGIVALVFDVIGLIILRGYIFMGYPSGNIMIVLPLAILAIICGGAGLYKNDAEHAAMAIGGVFLGGALLLISLWPLLYYMLGFLAMFYH